MAKSRKKGRSPKKVLRIPDLEHSKHAVLNSLPAKATQDSYEYAINEFISWYCSEPRLAFNRTVVLRYRFFLEQRNLAPSTINVRLAAIRRLAYEASDSGLLSPELAAGIARVKGAKRLGIRIGNWLSAEQGRTLLQNTGSETLRGKRDHAILAVLIGCGLRRAEIVSIRIEDLQLREEHWVIADLVGKKNVDTHVSPIAGGNGPLWSHDGRELFYRSGQSVMAVSVTTEPSFDYGNPKELFTGTYFTEKVGQVELPDWDISQDGKFLMMKPVPPSITATPNTASPRPKIIVVLNWFEELKQRVPAK
jgi:integrase